MKGATLILALCNLWMVNGQPIFLYPYELTQDSYMKVDAEKANSILSHHLRLDHLSEPYSESVLVGNDQSYERYLSRVAHGGGNFVGRGLESAMIVNVESHLSGEFAQSL
jgi:hypothetical protein